MVNLIDKMQRALLNRLTWHEHEKATATVQACIEAFDGISAPSEDARQWAKAVLRELLPAPIPAGSAITTRAIKDGEWIPGAKAGWLAYCDLPNGKKFVSFPIMPTEGEAVALLRMQMEDEGIKA